MNVKGIVVAALCAASLAADAAETVNGSYNTSLGYLAGKNASGERVTVMGAGAGGEMTGAERTDLMGAASGVRSHGLVDCVGIGYRALRGSTNMNNVVAIGGRAFENRSNVSDATWINGQFYAEGGTCYIKPDPSMPDEDAPIYYAGGNLYLNAGHIYIKGGASKLAATNDVDGIETASFAVYVSQTRGSDYNDGLTEETPVKTLDRAYQLAQDGDAVGVFAGTYPYPRSYCTNDYRYGASKRIRMHGIDGAARTLMVKGPGDTYDGKIVGCMNAWTTFSSWTFKYVKPFFRNNRSMPYLYVRFRDCVFDGLVSTNAYYGSTWNVCLLENCLIRNSTFVHGGQENTASYSTNPAVFADSILIGSVISGCRLGNGLHVGMGVHYENVWMHFSGEGGVFDLTSSKSDNFGTLPAGIDTTVMIAKLRGPNNIDGGIGSSWMGTPRFVGSLVGIDGLTNLVNVSESVVTNYAAAVAAADGDTLRVNREADKRMFFYGYGAAADRKTKDVVAEEVYTMLAEAETSPTAVKALATMRLAAMAAAVSAYEEATTNIVHGAYIMPPSGLPLAVRVPNGEVENAGDTGD